MPYTYKKEDGKYVVYKKDSGERVGATGGDKESLKKYLSALYMNAKENTKKENLTPFDTSSKAKTAVVTADQFHKAIQGALKNKKNISISYKAPNYVMVDGKPHKMVNGELKPLSPVTTEITQSQKTSQTVVIDTQISKLQTQIAALQKKKEQLSKQSTTDEGISLSKLVKKIKEAEDDDTEGDLDSAEAETPSDDATTDDSGDEKKEQPKGLQVKFNMANVKQYNNYPVVDNTGTVTGVSKEGISVLCGDNTLFVNFEDILS